jgi:hypothetical protein
LAGNTVDSSTLCDFLDRIERQYGKARRIWVMDRDTDGSGARSDAAI